MARWSRLSGLILILVLVIACQRGGEIGATPESAPTPTSAPTAAPVGGAAAPVRGASTPTAAPERSPAGQVVRLWTTLDESALGDIELLVDRFNRDNPHGIEVTLAPAAPLALQAARWVEARPGTTPPTLLLAPPHHAAALAMGEPFASWAPSIDEPTWGGLPAGVADPVDPTRLVVGYATTVLVRSSTDSAPTTLDEVERVACGSGNSEARGATLVLDGAAIHGWIAAHGGTLVDDATGRFDLTTPAVTAAFERLERMVRAGCLRLVPEPATALDRLASGARSLVIVEQRRLAALLRTLSADPETRPWRADPLPPTGAGTTLHDSLALHLLPGDADLELAAWLFARWLLEETRLENSIVPAGYLPAGRTVDALLTGEDLPGGSPGLPLAGAQPAPARPTLEVAYLILADATLVIAGGGDIAMTLEDVTEELNLLPATALPPP